MKEIKENQENTPPVSPYNEDPNSDDDLVYVGDDIDEVIEHLENAGDPEDEDDELMEQVDDEENNLPERDDSELTFKMHTDSLFCGNFHPNGELAVTGGEDDKAFVWKVDTGEMVFEISDHKDSVIAAEFSHDGNYLATGDMAGEIRAYKVDNKYKKVWEFSMGDMCWMKWHSKANVLMAGSDSGEIYIWRIPSGDCKVLQGSGHKCECATLTNDDKKLAAGYGDGSFKLWSIKDETVLLNVPSGERRSTDDEEKDEVPQSITTIATDSENNLIIAGSEDGSAKLIGPSGVVGILKPNPIRNLAAGGASENSEPSPVEKVLLDCPNFDVKVAVTGNLNGKVTIWDASHQSMRTECQDDFPTGITTLLWGKDQTLIAGTLGGDIKAWNIRNGESKFILMGHSNNIHDLSYHEKKNLLLSVSEDSTAKIFKMP